MMRNLDRATLDLAMKSLAIRLDENLSDTVEIVVCGGSALILTGMIPRTTKDVDVVALMKAGHLASPAPLPDALVNPHISHFSVAKRRRVLSGLDESVKRR